MPIKQIVTLTPKPLDAVLGAIIVPCTISLIHGPLLEDRAPLATLMHAVVTAGAISGTSIYLSATKSFKPRLIRSLCPKRAEPDAILESILRAQLTNLDHLQTVIQALRQKDDVNVIVLDGLVNIIGMSEFDGARRRQRYLYGTLELLRDIVNSKNLHMMITGSSKLVLTHKPEQKQIGTSDSKIQKKKYVKMERRLFGGNVLLHNVDTVVRIVPLKIDGYFLIDVEHTPVIPSPESVVVKITHNGIRKIK
jgi:hypothetical protein